MQRAHEADIIHRDIKPANVMITDREEVKIVDFGLAKAAGRTQLTKEGSTLGTVAYMSPEQTRGEQTDRRTDIWALGVVLYEMLTGQQPFDAEYDQAVMYSICNQPHEPVSALRKDVPEHLGQIVDKALAKKADERYQHVDEMFGDLQGDSQLDGDKQPLSKPTTKRKAMPAWLWAALVVSAIVLAITGYFLLGPEAESTVRVPIAVVDFVNQTNEPELNGLSGMLITSLEQSRRLTVFSRARMYDEFKQMDRPDLIFVDEAAGREIAKRASISALAVATIRKFGQLYTIDFKVIEPQSGDRLFSTKVEGKGQESIPGLIDRLSEKTRIDLKEQENAIRLASRGIAEVTTINLKAYQHYFKGEELINKLKFQEAEEELKKAISLDTTFALAYYRLAYAKGWWGRPGTKELSQKALQYIDKAPEKERYLIRAQRAAIAGNRDEARTLWLDLLKFYPEEKEVLFEVGDGSFHKADYTTAVVYLEKVLAIDPFFERALDHICITYSGMGRYDKMLEYAKQYVAKIPTSDGAYELLGDAYSRQADFDNALRTFQRAYELFPKSTMPIVCTGLIYIFKNEYEKAKTEFEKLLHRSRPLSDQRDGYRSLGWFHAYLGQYREVIKKTDKIIDIDLRLGDKTDLARTYAEKAFWFLVGWNDMENAKRAIEKGLQLRNDAGFLFYWYLFQAYLKLGEYEKALPIAKNKLSGALAFQDIVVRAFVHRAKGEYDEAIRDFQKASRRYELELALCYLETGQNEKAIEAVWKLQRSYGVVQFARDLGVRPVVYPKSLYLLGKIYEKKGDKDRAIENYEKFLDLWKNADADLPELIDAKVRLKGE